MHLSTDAVIAIITLLVTAAPILFVLAKYVQRRWPRPSPKRPMRLLPLTETDVLFDHVYITSVREARYSQRQDVFCKRHMPKLHGQRLILRSDRRC